MIDRFKTILNELSLILDTPLDPDRKGACKLNIKGTLHLQIECQTEKHRLLLASFLGEIPPGKFRENVLKDALKSNYPIPLNGTLSYSEKTHQLCLFQYISLEQLNGQRLFELLSPLIEKAEQWRMGIETGQTANLAPLPKASSPGLFGLSHGKP